MKRFMNKKVAAIGLAAGLALGVGTAAFAYFTSSGSGPGGADVGNSSTVTLTVGSLNDLYPGAAAQPVTYSFTNGNGDQNFGKVSVDLSSAAVDSTHATAGCTLTMLDLEQTTSTDAIGTVDDSATYTSADNTEPSVQMGDTGSSQNACEGATVTFNVVAATGS